MIFDEVQLSIKSKVKSTFKIKYFLLFYLYLGSQIVIMLKIPQKLKIFAWQAEVA